MDSANFWLKVCLNKVLTILLTDTAHEDEPKFKQITKNRIPLVNKSPTPFHAVDQIAPYTNNVEYANSVIYGNVESVQQPQHGIPQHQVNP